MKTPWDESFSRPHETLSRAVVALSSRQDGPSGTLSHAPATSKSKPFWKSLSAALRDAIEVSRTRRQLSALSDKQLSDIGVERADILLMDFKDADSRKSSDRAASSSAANFEESNHLSGTVCDQRVCAASR